MDTMNTGRLARRESHLPGTEGMAGYRDYSFHFRQFLRGAFGSVAGGLVIAGVVMLIDAMVKPF